MSTNEMTDALPIWLASGEKATSLTPTDYWPVERPMPGPLDGADKPIHLGDFLAEEHHKYYGRPWLLGKYYFLFLLNQGVAPHHNVLDFGCGAGRLGIHLIPYLESGRYFGMDAHLKSLVAFARYEAPLNDLASKAPKLMLDRECAVDAFGVAFDTVLDLAVSHHFPHDQAVQLYRKVYNVLAPGGRVFLAAKHPLTDEEMHDLGFSAPKKIAANYPLLADNHRPVPIDDTWHVFAKRG